jgi:hypothetical protein
MASVAEGSRATVDVLSSLVAPLNAVVFVLGNGHVSWAELLGFVMAGHGRF